MSKPVLIVRPIEVIKPHDMFIAEAEIRLKRAKIPYTFGIIGQSASAYGPLVWSRMYGFTVPASDFYRAQDSLLKDWVLPFEVESEV